MTTGSPLQSAREQLSFVLYELLDRLFAKIDQSIASYTYPCGDDLVVILREAKLEFAQARSFENSDHPVLIALARARTNQEEESARAHAEETRALGLQKQVAELEERLTQALLAARIGQGIAEQMEALRSALRGITGERLGVPPTTVIAEYIRRAGPPTETTE